MLTNFSNFLKLINLCDNSDKSIVSLYSNNDNEYLIQSFVDKSKIIKISSFEFGGIVVDLLSNIDSIFLELDKIINKIKSKGLKGIRPNVFDNLDNVCEVFKFFYFKDEFMSYCKNPDNAPININEDLEKNNNTSIASKLLNKYYDQLPNEIIDSYYLGDKKYEDYIMKTYKAEFNEYKEMSAYSEIIETESESQFKKEDATSSAIHFLSDIKNRILFLQNMVDFIYGISDKAFTNLFKETNLDINQLTTDDKILLALEYYNFTKADIILPNSSYSYVKFYNDNLLYLDTYIYETFGSNCNLIDKYTQIKEMGFKQYEIYDIKSFIDLLNICLFNIIKNRPQINKCLNCGNYFIPQSKSNEKYCDRISPQNKNKTCKEFGVKKIYREEIKSSDIKSEHNRISQSYRMRIKRAKTEEEKNYINKKFDKYKKNYGIKSKQYKANRITENEFVEWLKLQKSNK